MQKIYILIAILLVFQGRVNAQSYNAQRNQVFLVNVLSNAFIGGIGGAINKGKDEKISRAFIRNFLKGSAGGVIKYTAKYNTFYLNNTYTPYAFPLNRLCYFLGHSIVMNSAFNHKALETYYCNFDGIDIRISLKEEQKIKARLSLATLGCAVYFATQGFQFDMYRSLEYGQLLFLAKPGAMGVYDGQTLFNCIVINSYGTNPNFSILPHEIVHVYQTYDLFGISAFYDPKIRKFYKDKKIYKLLNKYVVADYEALFMTPLYLAQFHPMPNYYKNYYEFEAEHFRSRQYIKR